MLPCTGAYLVLVLCLDRGASVNVIFRERNVKVQSIKAAEARVRHFGQTWKSFPPRASLFVSKTKESEMKTRNVDYIAVHYVTKPAVALILSFL